MSNDMNESEFEGLFQRALDQVANCSMKRIPPDPRYQRFCFFRFYEGRICGPDAPMIEIAFPEELFEERDAKVIRRAILETIADARDKVRSHRMMAP